MLQKIYSRTPADGSQRVKIIYNQPTVKKASLNKEDLSNYCPIVNLSVISKITEKIVKKRLLDHLTSNSLLNPFQSAFFFIIIQIYIAPPTPPLTDGA